MAILVDFCHTKMRFQEKKILGTSLGKSKTTHGQKSNWIIFGQNIEMQNCQDYTDPTVEY